MVAVVAVMGNFPAEIWSPQESMCHLMIEHQSKVNGKFNWVTSDGGLLTKPTKSLTSL
jgi:hypothetical protein